MIIQFSTDFHVGVSRTKNTSSASAAKLREHIYRTGLDVVTNQAKAREVAVSVNLGDLFDKHSNPEWIVAQGAEIAANLDYVLGGNHDIKNVTGTVSSLSLIKRLIEGMEMRPEIIVSPDLSKPYCEVHPAGTARMYFVPHALSQELFVESLQEAIRLRALVARGRHVLCLHCNVGEAHGNEIEAEGSSLWLTPELQDLVAEHFDLTMIGHEHTPRTLKKGKIVVMGNLFPLGFGELEDRFVYYYNTETGVLEHELVFSAELNSVCLTPERLMELEAFGDVQFVDIQGEIKPEQYPALARKIQKLWRESEVLMVRNGVEVERSDAVSRQRVDNSRQTMVDLVKSEAEAAGFAEELAQVTA